MRDMTSGLKYLPGYFDRAAQDGLLATLRQVLVKAPFYTPVMPRSGTFASLPVVRLGRSTITYISAAAVGR